MKIKFNVNCLGFSVGGYNHHFELEIDKEDIKEMSEIERQYYIEERIYEHILDNLDYGVELI